MSRFVVLCCAVVLVALSFASPAIACMTVAGPQLNDLWPGKKADTSLRGAVLGVFESETTRRSPGDADGEWSITVITRYWGTPPLNIGPRMDGPFHETSCPFPRLGAVGDHHYGYVYEHLDGNREVGRASGAFSEVGSTLNAVQEAMLAERFGPSILPVAITAPPRVPTTVGDTSPVADSDTTGPTSTTQDEQNQTTTTVDVLAAAEATSSGGGGPNWVTVGLIAALALALTVIATQGLQRRRDAE